MRDLRVVTTSWDDGDPKDLRIADALSSRDLRGTFYVPILGYRGKKTVTPTDLKRLSSAGFEIGAHTVSHKALPMLAPEELEHEVRSCKQILEGILGHRVHMFCYPNGRYNFKVIRLVRDAGYQGARTTRMLSTNLGIDHCPFEMPTSVQAYPHPRVGYIKNLARATNIPGLLNYVTELCRFKSWVELGKRLFHQVLEHGGIWHLYGHSWEIDELGMWRDVHEMLDYVAHGKGVTYLTNGQLLSLLRDKPEFRSQKRILPPQAPENHDGRP
jgi:peptidoglycan/xylan/chitin deacetylase (PgdA/CDA1 family)